MSLTKENLVEGLKILTANGTCLEYVGPAENTEGEPCHAFELFESGSCIFCPVEGVDAEMEKHGFAPIPMSEWRRRVVALAEYQKSRTEHDNYLGMYVEMSNTSDEEIEKQYEALQPE